jgi:hypothetical protein
MRCDASCGTAQTSKLRGGVRKLNKLSVRSRKRHELCPYALLPKVGSFARSVSMAKITKTKGFEKIKDPQENIVAVFGDDA